MDGVILNVIFLKEIDMKKIFVILLLSFGAAFGANADTTVFDCTVKDGTHVTLQRADNKDLWTTTITKPNGEVKEIEKPGNNMATGFSYHAAANSANTEIYVNTKNKMYVLGYNDQGTSNDGYIQTMENGKQTAYGECDVKSFKVDFSKPELFENFTSVD